MNKRQHFGMKYFSHKTRLKNPLPLPDFARPRTNEDRIRETLMDIMDFAQEATYYADSRGSDFAFVALLNSIDEELADLKALVAEHENIRLRDDGILDFKPLQGWPHDRFAPPRRARYNGTCHATVNRSLYVWA
jgi:hypothetical protein